jgi:hypothetical protein
MGRWTGVLAPVANDVVRLDWEVLVCFDVRHLVSLTSKLMEFAPRSPSLARSSGQFVLLHLPDGAFYAHCGTFQEVLDEMVAAGWGRDRVAENLERIAGSLRELSDVFEEEFPAPLEPDG